MARKKNKKKPDHQAPSAVLLAARLKSGAGKHTPKPQRGTRSEQRRRAIQEAS